MSMYTEGQLDAQRRLTGSWRRAWGSALDQRDAERERHWFTVWMAIGALAARDLLRDRAEQALTQVWGRVELLEWRNGGGE